MTNQTVEAMLRGGVPVATIISSIRTAEQIQLYTSTDFRDRLVNAGASSSVADQILQAMHDRNYKGAMRPEDIHPAPVATAAIAPQPVVTAAIAQPVAVAPPSRFVSATPGPSQPPLAPAAPTKAVLAEAQPPAIQLPGGNLEIGVYSRRGGDLVELNPEVVNWKTGGVLKYVGTLGVVKGDINGRINRAHSPNGLHVPIELVVYAPEGVAITEYQLIRLHEHSDGREFRTVTGGILHVSGGSTRDEVDFEGTKIAPRTYSISLGVISAGEYGLVPPGIESSTSVSSSLGKMYTFRIVE